MVEVYKTFTILKVLLRLIYRNLIGKAYEVNGSIMILIN